MDSRTSRKPPPKRLSGRLREVVAYGRWSLLITRIEQQGVFSEKRSGHIYFVEDNLLQAISKLRMCSSMLLQSSSYMSYIPSSIVDIVNYSY